ncbi:hypothetical protein GCM10027431_30470 [Lysobacter rhizosphaerae]
MVAHAIAAAVAEDDLDRAIELGLLEIASCEHCDAACSARVMAARDDRLTALGARERYRARQARLQRRAQERAAARATPAPATNTVEAASGLPSAAAAALARARARAAERRKP